MMVKILPGLHAAAPAILMGVGVVPFAGENIPAEIRAGGACLAAIAMVLADLQTGKKLGYTDKIVSAMRTLPGMKEADEGTILGVLTLGACGFLGIPATMDMMQNGFSTAGVINNAYNYVAFPIGAAFAFNTSRRYLDRMLGKEMRFQYTDENGNQKLTTPISTGNLLQQVAFLSGAAGITAFGTALDARDVQFIGAMFMAANGLSVKRTLSPPISEVMAAKMKQLAQKMRERSGDDPDQPAEKRKSDVEAFCEQWDRVSEQWGKEKPTHSIELANLMRRGAGVVAGVVGDYLVPPPREAVRRQE